MGEVVAFPVQNNEVHQNKWELDAHFESQIEALEQQNQDIVQSIGFFKKQFPALFMSPEEVVQFLENTRGRVEEIEKQAA